NGEVDDIVEVVERGEMPPFQYTIIHTNAVFNAQEKQAFIQGIQSTIAR
ncbi:MAG: heme-binding domain-containing protein, partial [Anaerolineaceae bacterium]|nr:heme-binding domain-containing protein [Anaerolineaceae bacterium]